MPKATTLGKPQSLRVHVDVRPRGDNDELTTSVTVDSEALMFGKLLSSAGIRLWLVCWALLRRPQWVALGNCRINPRAPFWHALCEQVRVGHSLSLSYRRYVSCEQQFLDLRSFQA